MLTLALLASPAVGAGAEVILQPATYRSPSGRWTLAVDPGRRDGGGSGSYVLQADGELAWSGERPWAMWDTVVSDEGFVGGFAYSEGLSGWGADGAFHVLVLSPRGETLLDAAVERTMSDSMHSPANPLGRGVLHVAESDRFIVRVADEDLRRASEEWWCYELSTGREVFRKRPKEQLEPDEATKALCAVRTVAGTTLVIAQWNQRDSAAGGGGARYGLFDPDGVLLWKCVRPGDWEASDGQESSRWMDWMWNGAALPEIVVPRRFALWSPALEQRFNFEVVEAPGETPAWKVVELGSEPQARPPAVVGYADEPIPEVQLEALAVVELEATQGASGSPVRDIVAFAHQSAEVVRVVRRDDAPGAYTLLHVDLSGSVLRERALVLDAPEPERFIEWWPISDHAWLATQSPFEDGARCTAWKIEDESGNVRMLEAFDFPPVEHVAGFGDGSFAALGVQRFSSTSFEVVAAFDVDGEERWRRASGHDRDEPGALSSPSALAVTGDGSVVVLDRSRSTLKFYAADGSFRRALNLEATLGQEPNYPARLSADVDDGILLEDFGGTPSLWRIDAAGVVRGKLAPSMRDGRSSDELSRNARVAPDGKLWTSDEQRIVRLDERGVVDLELGDRLEPDALREASAASFDALGRVLIQDAESGAVHVFGADGARLFVGVPAASDVGEIDSIATIGASRAGGALVERQDGGYLLFGREGEPLGARTDLPADLCVNPATGTAVGTRYAEGLVLLDAEWKEVELIERRPDRRWTRDLGPPAMDNQGAIAVIERPAFMSSNRAPRMLMLYSPEALDGRMIELSARVTGDHVALGREHVAIFAYDNACWLVDRSSGATRRFQGPDTNSRSAWCWGFSADGRELLALEQGALRVHRFALP